MMVWVLPKKFRVNLAWSAPILKTFENVRKLDFFRLPAPRWASTAAGAGSLKKSNFLKFSKVLRIGADQAIYLQNYKFFWSNRTLEKSEKSYQNLNYLIYCWKIQAQSLFCNLSKYHLSIHYHDRHLCLFEKNVWTFRSWSSKWTTWRTTYCTSIP